jgi:putative SOS response-associated peptidase YedK
MCGRFTSTTPASELAGFFDAHTEIADAAPNYNVTPTSDVNVIVEDENGQRRLDLFYWGLVPSWAESPAVGSRLINARSETAATKPSFRSAFRRKRCIIPVDGFYEWVQVPERRKKQPVYISGREQAPLAFAGVWEMWSQRGVPAEPGVLRSCAILTGPPNELIAPLHDRMPMILPRSQWSTWLDHDNEDVELLQSLLVPAPESLLQWWPVSLAVNNVRNHGGSLIEPAEITPDGQAEGQGRLL